LAYDDQEIFDALAKVKGGGGAYLATRMWEVQLMNSLHMTIEQYSELPVEDRTRRIIAAHKDDWFSALDADKLSRKLGGKTFG
jgi:hypothetical protein